MRLSSTTRGAGRWVDEHRTLDNEVHSIFNANQSASEIPSDRGRTSSQSDAF
jgi:hypothetical protein